MGTLTIRTTEKQDQIIEEVQNQLNESVVSKTLLHCVMNYQDLLATLEEKTAKLEDALNRVNELEMLILNYVQGQQALMSAVPQFTSVAPHADKCNRRQNTDYEQARKNLLKIKEIFRVNP